jgi:hypothetical protein
MCISKATKSDCVTVDNWIIIKSSGKSVKFVVN